MQIEKLKNLVPFLTLLLIVCSAIKLITFYKAFGINIIDYMELSEFTFSFLDDIYAYIILIGGSLIWMVIDDIILSKRNNDIKVSNIEGKQRKLYRNIIGTFFLVLGLSSFLSIFFINWIVFMTAAYVTIAVYIYFQQKSIKIDTSSKYYLLVPTLLLYVFFKAKSELSYIVEKKSTKHVTLTLTGREKPIVTDSTNHYLGKTKNYTFFYNSLNKNSSIYPNNQIEMIKIGK